MKNSFTKFFAAVLTVSAFAVATHTAGSAMSTTVFLDKTNNNNFSDAPYASVTLMEMGADIQFTVTLLGTDTAGQNIEQFGFNSPTDLAGANFILPTDWTADGSATMDGFGNFNETISFAGMGAIGLDPLIFKVTGVADSILSYLTIGSTGGQPNAGGLFAVKISSSQAGAFIGGATPIPVPAALPLFLTALAGAGFMARRKRKAA